MADKKKGVQLHTTVHVIGEGEDVHVFGPGDEVPDWAVEKITWPVDRDDLWEGATRAPKAEVADDKGAPRK